MPTRMIANPPTPSPSSVRGCTEYRSLLPNFWRESHPEAVCTYRQAERRDASERQRTRREARRRHRPLTADFTPEQQAEFLRRAREKLLANRQARAAGCRPDEPTPTAQDG